jgi:hypothetical protein
LRRAKERIAEIKALLAQRELEPPGLEVALRRLELHLAQAVKATQGKRRAKKIVSLAREIDSALEIRQQLLNEVWHMRRGLLDNLYKTQREKLIKQVLAAQQEGDEERLAQLRQQLAQLEAAFHRSNRKLKTQLERLRRIWEGLEKKVEEALPPTEKEGEEFERKFRTRLEEEEAQIREQIAAAREGLSLRENEIIRALVQAAQEGNEEKVTLLAHELITLARYEKALTKQQKQINAALSRLHNRVSTLFTLPPVPLKKWEENSAKLENLTKEILALEKEARESLWGWEEEVLAQQKENWEAHLEEAQKECSAANNPEACLAQKALFIRQQLKRLTSKARRLKQEKERWEKAFERVEERWEQARERREKARKIRRKHRKFKVPLPPAPKGRPSEEEWQEWREEQIQERLEEIQEKIGEAGKRGKAGEKTGEEESEEEQAAEKEK